MTVRFYKSELSGTGRRDDWCDFSSGQTIANILGTTQMRAWVNGREVDEAFMRRARLKDGVEVYVEPIPRDPVSLSIAATVAATAAGITGGVAATVALTALSVALAAGSSLMAQKQAKNKGSNRGSFDRLNSITGTQNTIASFEAVPRLFGRMRYFPPIPMTAQPYTELKGDKQYFRMFFCLGYGPLDLGGHIVGEGYDKITEKAALDKVLGQPVIRIGDTDIAEYDDVQYEIGTPDQMTLYTDQVLQTEPNWTTESDASDYGSHDNPTVQDNKSTVRTTDTDATGFSIDIAGQLYTSDTNGKFKKLRIQWQVEWRISGSNDTWASDTFTQESDGTKTSRVNFSKEGLSAGQYDVRLTRVSTYFSNLEGPPSSKATWTALRTIRNTRAFTMSGTVTMAVKILATDQLKGTIDKLSVLPISVLDVYDTDKQAWVKRPSRAHAWAFASVMTDQANRQPIDKSDLNLRSLLAWEAETEAAGRNYDVVYDDNGTTIERMNDICAGGRANWTIDPDTSIRIVLDTVQAVPKMLVSPYNSFGYSYTMNAFDPPHAVKMRYIDTTSWQTTERTVYDDGYAKTSGSGLKGATIFETVDAAGCTDPDQAHKDGRRYLAKRRLRDIESHQFSQEIQHYKYGVGDLLELANEVILVSLGYGRLDKVVVDDDGRATEVVANTFLEMEHPDTQYGIKIHRMDGSVVTVRVENDAPGNDRLKIVHDGHADLTDIEPDCHFVFGESGKITTDVKVDTVTPKGDVAQVTCVPAALNILEAEDGVIPAPVDDISLPPDPSDVAPSKPRIGDPISDASVAIQNDDGSLTYRIAVPVSANGGRTATDHIDVQVKGDGALTYDTETAKNGTAYFTGHDPGDVVTIRARAFGENGRASKFALYGTYTVEGRIPPLPDGIDIERGTFEATFEPLTNKQSLVFDFYISESDVGVENAETNARKLLTGRTSRADDLEPDTQYWIYYRSRNTYAVSEFLAAQFRTKNEPNKRLQYATQQILEGPANSGPFPSLRARAEQAEADVAAMQARVDAVSSQVGDILQADTWDSSSEYPSGDLVQYNGQLYRAAQDVPTDTSISNTTYWTLIGDYASLGEAVGANAAGVSESKSAIEQQDGRIAANSQSISKNASSIGDKADASALSETNSTVSQQGEDISANSRDIRSNQTAISDAQNALDANSKALSSVQTTTTQQGQTLTSQGQSIESLQSGLSNTNGDVRALTTSVNDTKTRVSDAENTLTAQGSSIGRLTGQVFDEEGNPVLASVTALSEVEATAQEAIARYSLEVVGQTADGRPVAGRIVAGANGDTADLILDFDRLLVGRVNGNGVAPFVLDNDGNVIANSALIQTLVFGKLTDSSGNFIVDSNGRLKAEYIQANRLVVGYNQINGRKPPVDADKTSEHTSRDTQNVGNRSASSVNNDIDKTTQQISKGPDNKVGKPNFYDGDTSYWGDREIGSGNNIEVFGRDTIENHTFEVVPGEKLFCAANMYTNSTDHYVNFGIFCGGGTYVKGCGLRGGVADETDVSGFLTVPSGATSAQAWIQIDAFGDFGRAYVKNMYIGKYQPGSDITGDHTANDVKTGSGKAVEERGANKTENRVAKAIAGQGAFATLDKVTRNNIAAYFESAAITNLYVGEAAIDTLNVRGNAITLPRISVSDDRYRVNESYNEVCKIHIDDVKGPGIITANGVYQAGADGGWDTHVIINNSSDDYTPIFQSKIGETNDSTSNFRSFSVSAIVPRYSQSFDLYLLLRIRTYGSDTSRNHVYSSLTYTGLWR